MKTLENYLKQTSKHLFKFESENNTFYMKVIVNDNKFKILTFDENLNVTSDKEYSIDQYKSISPKGKEYIDTYLKNGLLFYRGYYPNYYKISTIKHFKKFKQKLNEYLSVKQAA